MFFYVYKEYTKDELCFSTLTKNQGTEYRHTKIVSF